MSRRALVAALLVVGASARLPAQNLRIQNAGPGPVAHRLVEALAAPHILIYPDTARAVLPRDSVYHTTVIVVGRDVVVDGQVRGDVIVVAGDAFVHPGARVDGAVIAIGGGAYPSALASVLGGVQSYREFTYAIGPDPDVRGGYVLAYEPLRRGVSPPLALPGLFGVRIPTYDRTNGLSLPFAPLVTLDTGKIEIEPMVTYRSQLGAFDPSLRARWLPARRTHLELDLGRATFTNDAWITSDLVNSLAVLAFGNDTRNYYRVDRVEGRVHRDFETANAVGEMWLGGRYERAWDVRPLPGAIGGPWVLWKGDPEDRDQHVERPNPAFPTDHVGSALVGSSLTWEQQRVTVGLSAGEEVGHSAVRDGVFAQTTVDLTVGFSTFKTQRFQTTTHFVLTAGDTAPVERWAFIGGTGTFPMIDLLSLGGDELLYLSNDYIIPFDRLALPVVGAPTLILRDILGGADVQRFPRLEHNLAARVAISLLRFEVLWDVNRRAWRGSFGLSLVR